MKWLADWLGWEEKDCYALDDEGSWDFWMEEVEPRIREVELWDKYISALMKVVVSSSRSKRQVIGCGKMMSATLEQRAEALRRVLE